MTTRADARAFPRPGPGLLAALAVLALVADLVLALVLAPQARGFAAPLAQRLFYVHVPAALAAYGAFAVALVASLRFLQHRAPRQDRVARSAAEVAALLTTIALFTGVVWSRVEFFSLGAGGDFTFALLADAKFVSTAALWLVLLGYLALRRGVEDPEARGRLAAAYAVLGFLAVPLSYLSSRFSPHPDFLAPGSSLAPSLAGLLLAATVCWALLAAALMALRLGLEEAHAAADGDPEDGEGEGDGDRAADPERPAARAEGPA